MAVTLVSVVPSSGSKAAVDANIVLTYSGPVQAGLDNFIISDEFGRIIFQESFAGGHASISGNTVTIDLPENLAYGTRFNFQVSWGFVKDSAGVQVYGSNGSFSTLLSPIALNFGGTSGSDFVHGSDLADIISGGSGRDQFYGEDGADQINGGDDADLIDGGAGNDALTGGNGSDNLVGGSGNDLLRGDGGDDNLNGGEGDDTLEGGDGNDYVLETDGRNVMLGGAGNDGLVSKLNSVATMDGGDGNDNISATNADTAFGGAGNDHLTIDVYDVTTYAGSASGGDGDDVFNIAYYAEQHGIVRLTGGAGTETYRLQMPSGHGSFDVTVTDFTPGSGGDLIDLGSIVSSFYNYQGNPFAPGTGFLRIVQSGSDTLLMLKHSTENTVHEVALLKFAGVLPGQLTAANFIGGYAPDGGVAGLMLRGTSGNDSLQGYTLDDKLYGGDGADTLYGEGGNDYLEGGTESAADGADKISGGSGNDTLLGGAGNDTLEDGDGDDVLDGGSGDDILSDEFGTNTVRGGTGNDQISVQFSTSTVDGGDGDDQISGGSASQVLVGGAGNDKFLISANFRAGSYGIAADGGAGDDLFELTLTDRQSLVVKGGSGQDTFVMKASYRFDNPIVIADFVPGSGDRLDLMSLLPADTGGNPFGSAGYLRLTQSGSDCVIAYDADGANGSASGFKAILTLTNVSATSMRSADFVGGLSPNGSNGGITLVGTSGDDLLRGGALNDNISGGAGRDTLYGDAGDDILNGGDETGSSGDVLYGGTGNDILSGGAGRDQLFGEGGDDRVDGGAGNDSLVDSEGNNVLNGGDGNDTLTGGGNGSSTLNGGDGDDVLNGGVRDSYIGGAGNDTIAVTNDALAGTASIFGGDGNDTIRFSGGTRGSQFNASGGAGSDVYVLDSGFDGNVVISDFAAGAGGDQFNLTAFVNGISSSTINPFGGTAYLRALQEGNDVLLQMDLDGGAGSAYGFRTFSTLKNITLASLSSANFAGGWDPAGSAAGYNLSGTSGNDTMYGGALDDTLNGLTGDDLIAGANGNDVLYGGDGNDILQGDGGNDALYGGAGDDRVGDSSGNNMLYGGAGNDDLSAGGGQDSIYGEEGDDSITVQAQAGPQSTSNTVIVDGGAGTDYIQVFFGLGSNTTVRATGGAGVDTFGMSLLGGAVSYIVTDFTPGAGGDRIDLQSALDNPRSNPFAAGGPLRIIQRGADTVVQVDVDGAGPKAFQDVLVLSNVSASALTANNFVGGWSPDGSTAAQPMNGTPGDDTLDGSFLDDTISAGAGADRIDGKAGNDTLDGGDGDDAIEGGLGNDAIKGGAGNDYLADSQGNNVFDGGDGDDTIVSFGGGVNALTGGIGNDRLTGGSGTDSLDGGAGDDTLVLRQYYSGGAADRLVRASGGIGNDKFEIHALDGRGWRAELTGGAGADLFNALNGNNDGTVIIMDFNAAEGDRISVAELFLYVGAFPDNVNPFTDGRLKLEQSGADTQLMYKFNGAWLNVVTLKNVAASSLTAASFLEGIDPRAGQSGLTLTGDDSSQRLVGSALDDKIDGGAGNDILVGLAGKDLLKGGEDGDTLAGGADDDTLDGGSGTDYAVFENAYTDYKVWSESGVFHVQALNGDGGHDLLTGIERLRFGDKTLALDIDGVGGQSYRLYQAAFNRTPDLPGLGFWIKHMDEGLSLKEAANFFLTSPEAQKLYGINPSNEDLVKAMYANVLHRTPEAEGFNFWMGHLANGLSRADMLAYFSESPENKAALIGVLENGFTYTPLQT
jgi:Ca2+-binding RTX toxin-like protein